MHVTINPMFTFVRHVSGGLALTLPVRAIFVIFTRLFSGNHCAAELIGIQKGSICDSAWLNKRRLLDLGRSVCYSSSNFIQWTRPQFIIRTQCGRPPGHFRRKNTSERSSDVTFFLSQLYSVNIVPIGFGLGAWYPAAGKWYLEPFKKCGNVYCR